MWGRLVARFKEWQQRRRDAVMFERAWVVAYDELSVTVTEPKSAPKSIHWNAIERVAIETNDSGPWGADVWWCLEASPERVAYPQGATGEMEMLEHYHIRLPGFDDNKVIEAMGCTDNARFVCWERAKNTE